MVTALLQRAFEMVSRLPDEEQDVIARRVIERVESLKTLETFLGDSLHRSPPSPEEMEELRALAEKDPGVAAALWLAERGGLDVDSILTVRNAEW